MKEDQFIISKYIVNYLRKECTLEEKLIVERWLEDPINRESFEKIKNADGLKTYKSLDIDFTNEKNSFYKRIDNKRNNRVVRIFSYAAVLALILAIPFIFSIVNKNKEKYSEITKEKINIRYEAPVLITSKGESIIISQNKAPMTIKENNGVKVNIKNNTLAYDVNDKSSEKIAYHTIDVPECGNFNFTMSDGTKVWLNAGTKLKYPIPFHKNKREIFLDGEGYFEVTKNTKKPFVVKLNKGSVKVLGTKFNIKSYAHKPITTTLVSGSVQVKDEHKNSVVLKPNEQAIFRKNNISISKVDPFLHTSWKDGFFIYNEVKLEEILQDLSKWYGVEYFYQNKAAANIEITARLRKFKDINEVLEVLENIKNIKFRIKNKSIVVSLK